MKPSPTTSFEESGSVSGWRLLGGEFYPLLPPLFNRTTKRPDKSTNDAVDVLSVKVIWHGEVSLYED